MLAVCICRIAVTPRRRYHRGKCLRDPSSPLSRCLQRPFSIGFPQMLESESETPATISMKTALFSVMTMLFACSLSAGELREESLVRAVGGPEMHSVARRVGLRFEE